MMNDRQNFSAVVLLIAISGSAFTDDARNVWNGLVSKNHSNRPEFAFVENDPDLPNVLIYGDSISIGYTQAVRRQLKGKANVYRIHCNGGHSGSFIQKMKQMHSAMQDASLDKPWRFKWDVIHFNVGLHDLKYLKNGKLDKVDGKQVSSIDNYKRNLRAIVNYLEQIAPDARLIFATTTPVPEDSKGRIAGDSARYNSAALDVLTQYPAIRINDLYGLTRANHSDWWQARGNVHYRPIGRRAQGAQVAKHILDALKTSRSRHELTPKIDAGN